MNIKRIIIFYQHIEREQNAILSIRKKLIEYNYQVYLYSINYEYVKAVRMNKKTKIDMIVMPWMYHEKNYELLGPFIETNENIILVNLHSEQISSPFSNKILLPKGDNPKYSVYHFVWGNFFKEKLINESIPERLIKVTGNCRTDFVFDRKVTRSSMADKYLLDIKKKWILFSENRGWVYNWNEKLKKERMSVGITEQDLVEYYELTSRSLNKMMDSLKNVENDFFNNFEFIYRPHPGTVAPGNIDKRIKVIGESSIYDWLSVVDVNVVWSSTTAFESDAMHVPTIVLESIDNKKKYRTEGLDGYLKIQSIYDLNDKVINEAIKIQHNKNIYSSYLGNIDGNSCKRIVEEIDYLLSIDDVSYKANMVEYNRFILFRRWVFECVTLLFSKLNIIKILKYPKSAYSDYKDIPWIYGKNLDR